MNLFVKNTKSLAYVPLPIWLILFIGLMLQIFWYSEFTKPQIKRKDLPSAPNALIFRLVSLDDRVSSAKLLMLWIQAFDNQPGISIPLKDLDYDRLITWLDLVLTLDNKMKYPLLAAIRFYAEVPDHEKQRKMIRYIMQKYKENPQERWQFMAHAVYIAKHRLHDMQLALECARLLRQYSKNNNNVPDWAKQMEIFVLEDMGEFEAAQILIGGLLDSGELTDPHQRQFLEQRLLELKNKKNP